MKSIIAASTFFYVLGLGYSIDYEPNYASREYFKKYGKGNSIPSIPIQADVDKEQKAVVCHKEKKYYDNTINDSKNLNFTSNNITYYLPRSNDALFQNWGGVSSFIKTPGSKVMYLRSTKKLVLRGKEGNCASTLDVLAWLMDELNKRHLILMIGYGELIHVHREKDFVNSTTGDYIDDDIDTWATLETVAYIGALEEELFSKFGWSMRAFVGANRVFFIQMMATCGHVPINTISKCKSSQPAIEVYPLPIVHMSDGTRIIKDLWQGSRFAETLIYPPKCITFHSSGRKDPIHLQVPRESIKILNCLYGQWNVKSGNHAGLHFFCRDDTEIV